MDPSPKDSDELIVDYIALTLETAYRMLNDERQVLDALVKAIQCQPKAVREKIVKAIIKRYNTTTKNKIKLNTKPSKQKAR